MNALRDVSRLRLGLVQRRKDMGFTQQQLADRLGVSRITVSRRETAESQPTALELALWCRALGLRLDTYLLHEKDRAS